MVLPSATSCALCQTFYDGKREEPNWQTVEEIRFSYMVYTHTLTLTPRHTIQPSYIRAEWRPYGGRTGGWFREKFYRQVTKRWVSVMETNNIAHTFYRLFYFKLHTIQVMQRNLAGVLAKRERNGVEAKRWRTVFMSVLHRMWASTRCWQARRWQDVSGIARTWQWSMYPWFVCWYCIAVVSVKFVKFYFQFH